MSLLTRAKLRPIGDVSRVQDPVVRGILQSIKEQLDTFRGVTPNGDVLDELVSKRELFDAGIIDVLRGGQRVRGGGATSPGNVVIPPMPDLPVPPAPTDLTANGGLSVILLTWSGYGYASHAYTEIWRASVDDLSQAVMIGTAQGQSGMYADTVGGSATYYYWVRFVAVRNGVVRVGPFNSTSGTVGQTGTDPSYLLDVLTGQITSSQLHNDLLAPIELIPDIALSVADIEEELQSINAVLSDIQQIPEFDDSETYNEGDLVRYEGGLYQAQTDMLTPPAPPPTNDTYWQKVGDYASLGEAVAAHAVLLADHTTRIELAEGSIVAHGSDISALEAAVYDGTTGLDSKASIVQLNAAKAEIYGAEVADFTKIAAQFSSVADDLATKATITQLNTAKSDILGSSVNSFTHIAAEFSTVRGEISTAAREARDNLIINPSFENGLSPHGAGNAANGGTWSIEDEGDAYHGGKVLQYDSTGQTGTAVFRFNGQTDARLSHVEARPGDRFRMSIWHRLKSGTANRIRIMIRARSATGVQLGASPTSNTAIPAGNWTQLIQEWEIPENLTDTAYVQTDVEVLADGNGGVHQFDMARLERLDAGAYQAITSTAAAILEEAKTYADEDSAAAQLAQTLQAIVGDGESGLVAAVQTNAQAISGLAEAAANLIRNPSFELGLAPHYPYVATNGGTWSVVEEAGADHGGKVLQHNSSGQTIASGVNLNGQGNDRSAHVPAHVGDVVRAEIRIRLKSGTAKAYRLHLRSMSASGDLLENEYVEVTPTSSWQTMSVTLKVSHPNAAYAMAVVNTVVIGPVGVVQFDSARLSFMDPEIYAEYTIKAQLLGGNPVIAGIGLIAEPGGSSIGLMANRIFFAHPSTGADISPFVYDADTETMHVKNASIVNLTADNFVGGKITADEVVSGVSITAPMIVGGRVQNSANTNFLNLSASGSEIFFQAGDGLSIRADGIATFRGSVFASRFRTSLSDSGERIDINPPGDPNRILWYDSSGVLRIRIGANSPTGTDVYAASIDASTGQYGLWVNSSTRTAIEAAGLINAFKGTTFGGVAYEARVGHDDGAHLLLSPRDVKPKDSHFAGTIFMRGTVTSVEGMYLKKSSSDVWEKLNNSSFLPGDVGSFAFLYRTGSSVYAPGSLHAAANLRWANANGNNGGYHSTGPSAGTWQLMGYCGGDNGGTTGAVAHRASLYLRVL